jgi:molybdenum cofactor cytidylyltransferase
MGECKPLLDLEGRTLLEWAIGAFTGAAIHEVVVVTGQRGADMAAVAVRAGAVAVANPDFDQGMFSSVRAGAAALDPGVSRFFLLPADVPLARPETIGRLSRFARSAGEAGPSSSAGAADGALEVLYPAVSDVTGHPPLVATSLCEEIIAAGPAGPEGGLGTLLLGHAARSAIVEVGDAGVLLDADTPEDLARLRERAAGELLPDEASCLGLLAGNGVPEPRVAHSRAVAAVAAALAAALNARGQHLCAPLVLAGGLLHDIARAQPRHADAGADLLERLGYRRVATVVRRHMELPEAPGDDVDEAQVVYLADKVVQGDRVVGLEERFARRLVRHRGDSEALAAVSRRKAQAQVVLANVERLLGSPIAGLLPAI